MTKLPIFNLVDVKVTYDCNMNCEYCYQVYNGTRKNPMMSLETADNMINFAKKLKEKVGWFYFTLAGGEPFTYPHLTYLAKSLSDIGHKVSTITNFTYDMDTIEKYILAIGKNVGSFCISVHLSQWDDIEVFYDKLRHLIHLNKVNEFGANIELTCVITEENYLKAFELERRLKDEFNLPIQLQRYYSYGYRYEKYSDEIEEALAKRNINVPIEEANKALFNGRKCWNGRYFFYIESNGNIQRCYAPQSDESKFILGNLADWDNITIFKEPEPCLAVCECLSYKFFESYEFVVKDEEES